MACQKPLWFFFFSAIVAVNFSHGVGFDLVGSDSACMQKLLPCRDYVKSPSPPSSCCDPLKSIISTDSQCLCKVFNDPDSLKSLSITQDDALGLAKSCGANPDVSACKTGSMNGSASASTNTTTGSAPASSLSKSGASAMSSRDGMTSSVSIALSVALLALFYSH